MRNQAILFIILTFCILNACKKEEPKPIFKIDKKSLIFDKSHPTNDIIISNIGDADLDWKIIRLPHWLKVYPAVGTLKPGVKVLTFTTEDFDNFDLSANSFDIQTNAGNEVIEVSLSLNLLIPGAGTKQVYINQTYSSIIETFGTPDYYNFFAADESGNSYFHVYAFSNQNFAVYFLKENSNQILPTDQVYMIQFIYPNEVCTNKWIGLGSSISDVQLAYGNTEYYDWYLSSSDRVINYHPYPDLGIEFYFVNNNYLSVQNITIFPPVENAGQAIPKAIMEAHKNPVMLSHQLK